MLVSTTLGTVCLDTKFVLQSASQWPVSTVPLPYLPSKVIKLGMLSVQEEVMAKLHGEAIATAPELSPDVLQFFECEREIGEQVVGGDDPTSLKVGEEEEEERELSAAPTEASEEARLSTALKKSRKRTASSTPRSCQQGSEFELEEEQGEGSENNYTSACASLPMKPMNSASHLLEEF